MNRNGPYPQAAPVRTAEESLLVDRIDSAIRDIASSFGASEKRYPALIARAALEQAEYPQAFPHLLMSASAWRPGTTDTSASRGEQTGWCLSPAVCYHAYAQLAGCELRAPVALTARGSCFRHEAETAPGTRQIEFEMRELVFVGPADWVDACAEAAKQRVEAAARDLGLAGDWQVAEDPFFLPAAKGKALLQRLTKVKLEYQSHDVPPVALASVNRHGAFFGRRFDITGPGGTPVHTACVAVGLDRWWRRATSAALRGEAAICSR